MGEVVSFQTSTRFERSSKSCLEHLNSARVTFAPRELLESFTFESRMGLFVEKSFSRLFGKRVMATDTGVWLSGNRLLTTSENSRVVRSLSTHYAFFGTEGMRLLKPLLATLLLSQWKGNPGILTEDGTENVFFFQKKKDGPQYAIEIFREVSRDDWYLSVVEYGNCTWLDCEWQEGAHIFSAQKSLSSHVVDGNIITLFP